MNKLLSLYKNGQWMETKSMLLKQDKNFYKKRYFSKM